MKFSSISGAWSAFNHNTKLKQIACPFLSVCISPSLSLSLAPSASLWMSQSGGFSRTSRLAGATWMRHAFSHEKWAFAFIFYSLNLTWPSSLGSIRQLRIFDKGNSHHRISEVFIKEMERKARVSCRGVMMLIEAFDPETMFTHNLSLHNLSWKPKKKKKSTILATFLMPFKLIKTAHFMLWMLLTGMGGNGTKPIKL